MVITTKSAKEELKINRKARKMREGEDWILSRDE